MRMPSGGRAQHAFARVPRASIERSQFNRSHGLKTTLAAGFLVPVYVDEVLPGDTFNLRMSGFCRMGTPLKPLMDNLYVETFYFFVPYRLVWTNFQKFMGEQANPGDSTSFVVPVMPTPVGGYAAGSLGDYFGLPTVGQLGGAAQVNHSALPLRAYTLIYNTWFRDENLINSAFVGTGDGPDNVSQYPLQRRGKRHDYFTSCLPFPQKGTAVTIPLGTSAPVIPSTSHAEPTFWNVLDNNNAGALQRSAAGANTAVNIVNAGATGVQHLGWNVTSLIADLSTASGATINSLRQAFQIQKLLERDARGGTRYTEIVKSHFGVTSPDARLQRPEYLGGGSAVIVVSPIAQTAQTGLTGGSTPLGNLAAIGTGSWQGHGFAKSFTEHGVLIGLVCIRADLTYQQGMERQWTRSTRYDFYWPALAHIGEQAVRNDEIYCKGDANDPLVFGYQERYAEYRYKPSRITGKFRSTDATPLDVWHLAQKFTALPTLAQTFIEETPPMSRVLAVPSEPEFILDAFFDLKCARPMPVFGVPGLIDHF